MHQLLRAAMSAVALLGLAAAAGCSKAGAGTGDETAARGGAETFVLTTSSSAPNPAYAITAAGVFAAKGTLTGIGAGQNSSLAKVAGGSFVMSHPVQDEKVTHRTLSTRTCAVLLKQTGSFTLSKGTGDYAGLTGYGTDNGTFTATLPRKKDGACNTSSKAQPVAGSLHVTIRASGTLLIPPRKAG
jgi:hypothetical protein